MSYSTSDMFIAFEAVVRTSFPTLPAGSLGFEKGWRPSHELQPGSLPHLFVFNYEETADTLIFRQSRVRATFRCQLILAGGSVQDALNSWDLLRYLPNLDASLSGTVDQWHLELADVEVYQGEGVKTRAVTFSVLISVAI